MLFLILIMGGLGVIFLYMAVQKKTFTESVQRFLQPPAKATA